MRNFALIPVALLIALILCEIVARLWVAVPSAYPVAPGLLVLDQRGFWMPEPGYIGEMDNRVDFQNKTLTINPDGSRHVPCAADLDEDRRQIFVLGDSQTFGFGLADAETWPNRLQCALGADGNADTSRVYNLGVHGTNVDQYVRRGMRQVVGAMRDDDLVIVGVTWNDLISAQTAGTVEMVRNEAVAMKVERSPLAPKLKVPRRHLNHKTWRYRLYQSSGILIPSFSSLKSFAESLTYSSALAHLVVPRLRLLIYRFRDKDSFVRKVPQEAVANNMALLAILAGVIEKHGGHMVVYLLDNRLFFDDVYYRSYSAGGNAFPAQDYMSYLTAPYCERFSLDCLSAFATLQTPGPDTYTFPFDGHYNALGAEAVAGRLRDHLTNNCGIGVQRCPGAAN